MPGETFHLNVENSEGFSEEGSLALGLPRKLGGAGAWGGHTDLGAMASG